MKTKKGAKSADVIFIVSICIIVLTLGICVYALPRQDFSTEENRALAPLPRISVQRLIDGSFFNSVSTFYSDRIPLRRTMIRVKAVCELALGRSENNGVLFLDGGRLCDRCEYKSERTLDENLLLLKKLCAQTGAQTFLVPRAADVYFGGEESEYITNKVYSSVGGAELFETLKENAASGGEVYYKTDHHLTADGAYVLYCAVIESLGDTPYPKEDFDIRTVSRDFLGSAYSASGLLPFSYDGIELYRYGDDTEFCVSCDDAGCELDGLYCFDKLEEKDKYGVFLGGNHGVIHVESGEGRKRILIIKDSFANAVIPLLARHYDLTVIDPRYADIYVPDGVGATVVIMGIDTAATLNAVFDFDPLKLFAEGLCHEQKKYEIGY